jgi:hypothetical protein
MRTTSGTTTAEARKPETKPTQGAWSVGHANFDRKPVVVSRRAGRPVTVALLDSGVRGEDEANARLIAAAPDMLAAGSPLATKLRELLDMGLLKDSQHDEIAPLLDAFEDALAKARGEAR